MVLNFGMSKNEFIFVVATLLVIGALAFVNFQSAEVQARDVQRKNDLRALRGGFNAYFKEVGAFPKGQNGKVVACGNLPGTQECVWGADPVVDPKNPEKVYIKILNVDPKASSEGYAYVYFSNTRDFQLLAHLERRQDAEYNEGVAKRGISCGTKICNFGVGASDDKGLDRELPSWTPSSATESGFPK